jgi:hypothetical protein
MSQPGEVAVPYDEAPLRPFHVRVAVASFGGVFRTAWPHRYIEAAQAIMQLQLTPLWLGLRRIIAGLFLGASDSARSDRWGRRPVRHNMLPLAPAPACSSLRRLPCSCWCCTTIGPSARHVVSKAC